MLTNSLNKWWARSFTLLIWALAAASAAAWGLRLTALTGAVRPPAPAAAPGEVVPDAGAVARVLGSVMVAPSAAPAVSVASRYALLGVIAARSERGAALISIDGKPPRAYRVGSMVGEAGEGLVLQAVESRRARLGTAQGSDASVTLELPPLKR